MGEGMPTPTIADRFISLTKHQQIIEGLSSAWPQGLTISKPKMHEQVCQTLQDLGWGEGVGYKQFTNWLKMIAPCIPPKSKNLGATAYKELLYLAYWMWDGEGKERYLTERKQRLEKKP